MQDDGQLRVVDLQTVLVINETQSHEFLHEEMSARSRRADHFVTENTLATLVAEQNGTWIGSFPVTKPTAVRDGEELRFESVVVTIGRGKHLVSTPTVARPGR